MERLTVELRRTLEAMPAGIVAVDANGQIFFANRNLEALSGYSSTDLIGRPVELLIPAERRRAHRLQRSSYQRAGAPPRPMGTGLDIRLRRKDGSEFSADVALSPVETEVGRIVIAAVRDVTNRPAAVVTVDRMRLEHDLHDGALQTLFGVSLNLQSAAAQSADSVLAERLEEANRQIGDVVRDLRNYIYGLLPGILAEQAVRCVEDASAGETA